MRFFFFLSLLTVLLTAGCSQQPEQKDIFRVGVIQYTNTNDETRRGFIDGMTARGYISGENIEYLYYGNAYTFTEIDGIIDRVLEMKPDLLYTSTTPASLRAYKKTKELGIPVVFGPVNDPVKAGIVSNLRAPGENATGIRLTASDQKRLEWLTLLSPAVKTVLVPHTKNDTSSNITLELIQKAGNKMGLNIISYPVSSKKEILTMIKEMPDNIQAVLMPRDGLVMSCIQELAEVCLRKKMILSTPRYAQIKEGATTGYGFIDYELGKQASRLADLILKGTSPGLIPVETAEDYLFINTEAASAIGLEVSDTFLRQAYKE